MTAAKWMVEFRRRQAPGITHRDAPIYLVGRLAALGTADLLALLAGCASSRDLTRTRAAEMIGISLLEYAHAPAGTRKAGQGGGDYLEMLIINPLSYLS